MDGFEGWMIGFGGVDSWLWVCNQMALEVWLSVINQWHTSQVAEDLILPGKMECFFLTGAIKELDPPNISFGNFSQFSIFLVG